MQADEQKQNRAIFLEEIKVQAIEPTKCIQIRKKLDALLDGNLLLEETPADIKRSLFRHLEICRDCCRSFDVRVHFRSARRALY